MVEYLLYLCFVYFVCYGIYTKGVPVYSRCECLPYLTKLSSVDCGCVAQWYRWVRFAIFFSVKYFVIHRLSLCFFYLALVMSVLRISASNYLFCIFQLSNITHWSSYIAHMSTPTYIIKHI